MYWYQENIKIIFENFVTLLTNSFGIFTVITHQLIIIQINLILKFENTVILNAHISIFDKVDPT